MGLAGSECFVCGFTREAYDDFGGGHHFDDHKKEHDVWNYLLFLAYILNKDRNGESGQIVNLGL